MCERKKESEGGKGREGGREREVGRARGLQNTLSVHRLAASLACMALPVFAFNTSGSQSASLSSSAPSSASRIVSAFRRLEPLSQFPCPLSLAFFFSPSSEPRSICLCLPVSRPISLLHTFVGRQDQVRVMAGIMLTLSSAKTAVRSSETSRPTCALTRSASHFLRLAPSSATESSAS